MADAMAELQQTQGEPERNPPPFHTHAHTQLRALVHAVDSARDGATARLRQADSALLNSGEAAASARADADAARADASEADAAASEALSRLRAIDRERDSLAAQLDASAEEKADLIAHVEHASAAARSANFKLVEARALGTRHAELLRARDAELGHLGAALQQLQARVNIL
ncbi:hypothetical protein T492DRAFT_844693 [Pavlovales sp. CCMP2436]|nr:hypothetical protein T492DRAFT_844693 [Pavlovales sp. CCMP2436]